MNITQYINSNEILRNMNFATVYQTILTLISDDLISMDDFEKVKPAESGFYKN